MHHAFSQILTDKITAITLAASAEGFLTLLTGGAVRDYIFSQGLSSDIDLEILPINDIADEIVYLSKFALLCERLKKITNISITNLNFNVIRMTFSDADFEIEIAPARIELYSDSKAGDQKFGHSDFKIKFMLKNNPEQAALRRDFTINAISYLLFIDQEGELQSQRKDPLGGASDISVRVLRECSMANFAHDPVRLLRLIRFQLQFNMTIAKSVTRIMPSFCLEKLTDFYFYKEAFKVKFFEFMFNFYKCVAQNELVVNDAFDTLNLINIELIKDNLYIKLFSFSPQNKVQVILTLLLFLDDKELVEKLSNQIQVKKKVFKKLCIIKDKYCLMDKNDQTLLQQESEFGPYLSYLTSIYSE